MESGSGQVSSHVRVVLCAAVQELPSRVGGGTRAVSTKGLPLRLLPAILRGTLIVPSVPRIEDPNPSREKLELFERRDMIRWPAPKRTSKMRHG